MIYLLDNPLLQEPLQARAHQEPPARPLGIEPRPGLHLHSPEPAHQEIRSRHDLPGRPGPRRARRARPGYLEGTYSEIYPDKSEDDDGLREFFKQFSFPGGIGSHCTPETPGSIHEGGELGYVLSHACGAAFDNPDLIVAAVVGDGESETGPLATSWHINKFLNPIRDGAVLPILHLNGYKINNPDLLARITHEELENLLPRLRLDAVLRRRLRPRQHAPGDGRDGGALRQRDPRHPAARRRSSGMRQPAALADDRAALAQGLDGAAQKSDGHQLEGFWRAHQVPLADVKKNPEQLQHSRKLDAVARSRRNCSTRTAS